MIRCERSPAECFSHACIFDIVVCGETLDEHRDHLDGDVLHQAGQSNGGVKGGVCKNINERRNGTELHNPTFSVCISGH